jgi:FYVE/RhoGEF/PH domain-containing protein 5/6
LDLFSRTQVFLTPQTFYIADPMAKGGRVVTKAARACEECYETVFPLLHLGEETETEREEEDGLSPKQEQNATPSLSGLPSWFTLFTPTPAAALMAMTRKNDYAALARASELLEADEEGEEEEEQLNTDESVREMSEIFWLDGDGRRVVKAKEPSNPRSYYEIVEDFQNLQDGWDNRDEGEEEEGAMTAATESAVDLPSEAVMERKRENTERKLKRFSSPALALQTTSVLAQTSSSSPYSPDFPVSSGIGRERGRRLSLVPAGGKGAVTRGGASDVWSGKQDLGKGMAAGKLHELLGKQMIKGC